MMTDLPTKHAWKIEEHCVVPACQCKFVMKAGWFVTHWVKDLSSTFGQVNKLERMGWKGWKVSKVFFALILCLFLGFVFSITFFLCFFVCVCVCVEETSEVWILSRSYLSLCICRHEKRSQLPERPIILFRITVFEAFNRFSHSGCFISSALPLYKKVKKNPQLSIQNFRHLSLNSFFKAFSAVR